MNHTVHFETLGCRLNQDETEGAARAFVEADFYADLEPLTAQSPVDEQMPLCVVNTCTVTGKAEQKARRVIRLCLEKYPAAQVIVTGCYAELDSGIITSICPERIIVLPGTKKQLLSPLAKKMSVMESLDGSLIRSTVIACENQNAPSPFTLYTPVFEKHSRASIKIEDGCNNSCTFCRIHLARGRAVSLSVPQVLDRVRKLEEQGANEVVFTGVNLSQYAGTMDDTPAGRICSFSELLEILIMNTKKIKFRISSFYPQSVDKKLCEVIKTERVQPSFHLSIQSGSDRILSLMKRPYTEGDVITAVQSLRDAKGNPFISCDLIAGFPGETENDFALTRQLCEESRFAYIHAFPFSPRPGTPAFSMKPAVPERVKGERVAWLTDYAVKGKTEYIASFAEGSPQCVPLSAIVENSRNQRAGAGMMIPVVHAVTSNFIHVECRTSGAVAPGTEIKVKIIRPVLENIRNGAEIEAQAAIL